MKLFPLPAQSRLKLTKATPRKESHGKELVQAISLRLEWWPTDNAAVNLLHEGLQDLLWWVPPEAAAQASLDGVSAVKKHRRVPTLQMPLKVEAAFSGYTVVIDHGIDETTALELYACALDKFEVDAKEGGSVVVRWSLATNKQVTPQLVGVLCGLEGTEIVATLTPPAPGTEATGAAIDGTVGHPGAANAGQGSLLDSDETGGEGGDDSTGEGDGLGGFDDDMARGSGDPEPDDDGSGHPDVSAAQLSKAKLDASGRSPFPSGGAKTDSELATSREAQLQAEAAAGAAPKGGRRPRKAVAGAVE